MKPLTILELQVLSAVLQVNETPYGATIKDFLARLGQDHALATVHSTMMQLAHRGFLILTPTRPENPRRGERTRNVASITKSGREAVRYTLELVAKLWSAKAA